MHGPPLSPPAHFAILLLASSRPHELIATNGRMPKWQCLRKCCVCQDGEMVTADVQKARKAAAASQAAAKPAAKPALPPKPAMAAKRPAAAPQQQHTSSVFVVQRREPIVTAPSAAARLHAKPASTFAAEQERLAREERERQRQDRQAAKAARKQVQELKQEQSARSAPGGGAAEGDASSDESSSRWLTPTAQALSPSASASSLGAVTPQLSQTTSIACSLTPHGALPGFSLGASVAAWSSSDFGTAAGNGTVAGGEEPAAAFDAAAAVEPESVYWLPPQFDREEPPEAEVDELMRMMMGLG